MLLYILTQFLFSHNFYLSFLAYNLPFKDIFSIFAPANVYSSSVEESILHIVGNDDSLYGLWL